MELLDIVLSKLIIKFNEKSDINNVAENVTNQALRFLTNIEKISNNIYLIKIEDDLGSTKAIYINAKTLSMGISSFNLEYLKIGEKKINPKIYLANWFEETELGDGSIKNAIELKNEIDSSKGIEQTQKKIKILIVAHRAYPFGGGEEFLLETSRKLLECGYDILMCNIRDNLLRPHKKLALRKVKGVTVIEPPEIDTDQKLRFLLDEITKWYVPSAVHSQGEINTFICENIDATWPLYICGFHFWTGLIELSSYGNIEIIKNLHTHQVNKSFVSALRKKNFVPYVVSPFMNEVLIKKNDSLSFPVILPIERKETSNEVLIKKNSTLSKIAQLNCQVLKGGVSFIQLALKIEEKMPNTFFFEGYCATDNELKELANALDVKKINFTNLINRLDGINFTIRGSYFENVDSYLQDVDILLNLSKVDETFSRVIVEGIDNDCLVLATAVGNIKNLLAQEYLGNADDLDFFVNSLVRYHSVTERNQAKQAQRVHLRREIDRSYINFIDFFDQCLRYRSKKKNVVIVCPWADQGLGYHGRAYVECLRKLGIKTHIYSFQPYSMIDYGLTNQVNHDEWRHESIHYSYNTREDLTAHEIVQFARATNSQFVLWIEICWEANWTRLYKLYEQGLEVILVPNAETIRAHEINRHSDFMVTLCTTRLTEKILKEGGVKNTKYIGHGWGNPLDFNTISAKQRDLLKDSSKIKILHVAGYNHERKMTDSIISAFVEASKFNKNLSLTVVSQVPFSSALMAIASVNESLKLSTEALDSKAVQQLYFAHHLSLQLSSHEGLGLGFYESIAMATPVITIDHAPHNEPILDGESGILIRCDPIRLSDNSDALIHGGLFVKSHLIDVLCSLRKDRLSELIASTAKLHRDRFSIDVLTAKLNDVF
jgi:glycosyltransferase involved in cell wall biosynthesis